MREIINVFPREIAFPKRRLCLSEQDFYTQLNKNNKLKDIYYSLYECDTNRCFDNCTIDKAVFDFDSAKIDDKIPEVKKLSDFLLKKNIKHLITFSGKKGFHVYVFMQGSHNLKYKKDALDNFHVYIRDTLKINPDEHLFGNLKQIMRVPNTFHTTGKRYCIPITRTDLMKGGKHIKEKAKKQNFTFTFYGTGYFDLKQFDKEKPRRHINVPCFDYDLKVEDGLIKNFLPCMQNVLLDVNKAGSWIGRYEFVKYCRDIGLPVKVADKIAKKYFSKVLRTDNFANNYEQFCSVKCLEYGYVKGEFVRNCRNLYQLGICSGRCDKFCANGFPLYK